jgi:hypothetical protein
MHFNQYNLHFVFSWIIILHCFSNRAESWVIPRFLWVTTGDKRCDSGSAPWTWLYFIRLENSWWENAGSKHRHHLPQKEHISKKPPVPTWAWPLCQSFTSSVSVCCFSDSCSHLMTKILYTRQTWIFYGLTQFWLYFVSSVCECVSFNIFHRVPSLPINYAREHFHLFHSQQ